ncbi:hypothetical protein ACIBBD_34645 [Streptomyces sp. NPDC051315]|uniref:hypothetical protein n=1 Tax=Streptomyces sp. NPDC051315 TaxID=3365650 RepID=UPI0037A3243C
MTADLGAMVLLQASACCWFACLSDPLPPGAAVHGEVGAALYLAMTLVTTVALRVAAPFRPSLSVMVLDGLSAVAHRLGALTSVRTTSAPATDSRRLTGVGGDRDDEPVPETLPNGAVARRGPPLHREVST